MTRLMDISRKRAATRIMVPVAVGAAAVFALGACGGGSSPGASAAPSDTGTASGGKPSRAAGPAVALERAGAAAVRKAGGGTVVSIELENRDTVWETQVVAADGTEHELNVSTADGTVRSAHVKREGPAKRAEHQRRVRAAKVGYAAAARKVRAAVPGGTITELNLDDFRGTTVWESDIHDASRKKHEVKIDAVTGTVVANTAKPVH